MVRTSSLRRVFVSVKGYYFQAEVQGQLVTWLVPHPLAQVLPNDVDYKVMLTFLELYSTMVRFVLAKLYHDNGLKYPPVLEASLEEAGTGLQAIVHQSVGDDGFDVGKKQKQSKEKKSVNGKNKKKALPQESESESEEESDEEIDSEEEEDHEKGIEQHLKSLNAKVQQLQQEITDGDNDQGTGGKKQKDIFEDGDDDDNDSENEDLEIDSGSDDDNDDDDAADPDDADIPAAKIKGTVTLPTPDDDIHEDNDIRGDDDDDGDAAIFSTLFKGLVFFLGREVPKEQLLIVIRSFGGEAGWEGEGSPLAKSDPTITHQVMDRPLPSAAAGGLEVLYKDMNYSHPGGGGGGRRREFIQPQWVFDSANAKVLVRSELYAPGQALPPHLSPFVNEDEEGYVPEYGQQLKELREAALAAKRASSQKEGGGGGGLLGSGGEEGFVGEKKGVKIGGGNDDGEAEEAVYAAELAKELGGGGDVKLGKKRRAAAGAGDGDDQEALKDVMMTRKTKKMYATLKKQERAKKARVEELETKAKKLK